MNCFPVFFNIGVTAGIVILFVLLAVCCSGGHPKCFSYALWSVVLFRLPVSRLPLSPASPLLGLVDIPTQAAAPHTTTVGNVPPDIVHAEDPQVSSSGAVRTAVNEVLPKGKGTRRRPITLEAPMAIAHLALAAGNPGHGRTAWRPTSKYGADWSAPCRLRDNICLADHIPPLRDGPLPPQNLSSLRTERAGAGLIIRHGHHHIRRGDHIVKVLSFAALCIHWFNPWSGRRSSCPERIWR